MEKSGGPPITKLKKWEAMAKEFAEGGVIQAPVDFDNTEIAFKYKSNDELRKAVRLFGLMNQYWLVNIGAKVGMAAIKLHLPFVESVVKNTIFEQFCGGTTLLNSQKTIDRLCQQGVLSILDYGAEAKESEEDFNFTMNENIRAIEFAAGNPAAYAISTKITGLARFGLLEAVHEGRELSLSEQQEFENVLKRLDAICHNAWKRAVCVFIDAEESWIQNAIDQLADTMMMRYNKERIIVYNTFQMYRKDRLQFLNQSYNKANREQYILGAKLVRGAYLEKERDRAEDMGYPSPVHDSKEATDDSYNAALRFCLDHHEGIALCNASHNMESARILANAVVQKQIQPNHPHVQFAQLLGMSDNLTFNLADAGFQTAKYVVYGAVRDVVPYLIRRAQENTSVTGDMTRELGLVIRELKRRGLA